MLYHPVVLAKMALGIHEISRGRFAINLVNAWNRQEIEPAGLPFAEHDARYAYGAEWLSIVRRLTQGERLTHQGPNFRVDDYALRPTPPHRPRIYLGGESDPARALAAAQADTWFINGQPIEDVRALIADARSRERPPGSEPLRFGLSAFVIARDTQAEADAAYHRLLDLAALDRPLREKQSVHIDQAVVMKHTMSKTERVGTNGGTAAGLVGSYDQVADRMTAFHAAGIELFMLQFQPFEAEMRRFAREIFPRVRD
jgi:alkanesulfonate monooxygenase